MESSLDTDIDQPVTAGTEDGGAAMEPHIPTSPDHQDEGTTELPQEPLLSKGQMKKIKKREKWLEVKSQKRKEEKERYKVRKRAMREKGEDTGPTRKQLSHNTMDKSPCRVRVAVDCGFDKYMTEKDVKMLVKQVQFSYSANRRATSPLQLYCTGIEGKTKRRLEELGDYKGWDVHFREERYSDLFEKASIVYLSSESPNVLSTLEEGKVYVIGGLVDHNHHKGLCHRLAEEKGLTHAQLPISEYIDMKTRKVLAVNHVFEILLRYTETNDWKAAFYSVIPQRKLPTTETSADKGGNSADPGPDIGEVTNERVNSENKQDDMPLTGGIVGSQAVGSTAVPVGVSTGAHSNGYRSAVAAATGLDGEITPVSQRGDTCGTPEQRPENKTAITEHSR